MDDFQSSDIDFGSPPQNPFHEAGRASIIKMMDHALEDRIASKRQVKQLTFVKGSPSTQYIRTLWWNRFNEFRQSTLNKGAEALPVAEDLERFFTTIVSRVVPRTNQVPAYTWLKSAVGVTAENCVFYHKSFTLSPHERSRIATLLDSLLQEGKVTQDPTWERRWAGVVVVRKLVCSLVNQAFEDGTMTWDITVAKSLSIILVASLGARTGDVTVAPRDRHALPYLAYKDVVIKMREGGSTVDDLDAVLTALDPKKKRIVLLKALTSPSDSLVCPVKLLLTLALRLGNVEETSIDDLVMHTTQRKNRTVHWRFPERPVFCTFYPAGVAVKVEKPAGNHQLSQIMGEAALAAGMLDGLHAHDLRRGAAWDTANLTSKGKGVANKVATTALGHSMNAANRQLTAHYVGAHDDDLWTKRIDENYIDSVYDIPEAEHSYQRRFQSSRPQEITNACLAEGLDEKDPNSRHTASRRLEKRRQTDWAEQESRKRHMTAANIPSAPSLPIDGLTAQDSGIVDTSTIADDTPLDPQLVLRTQELCNVIIGTEDGANQAGIEGLLLDNVQGAGGSPTIWLDMGSTLSFVQQLSTINVSCDQGLQQWGNNDNSVAAREKLATRLQGNSRDAVTSFMYPCKNRSHGCTFTHGFRVEVARHELVCSITSQEVFDDLAEKQAAKTFACTEEGCSKTFDPAGKRNAHVKAMHGWPKPCPKGCRDDETEGEAMMFDTRNALNRHMETHSNFQPSKCLVPDCKSTTVFTRSKIYRKHIQQTHKLMGKAIDPFMPFTKKAKWEPTKCRISDCESQATFVVPNTYKTHLCNKHAMDDVQVEEEMSRV